MNIVDKNAAILKFHRNAAFRKQVVDAAKAKGILPKSIDPNNLAALLQFILQLLPIILALFKK